VSCLASDRAGEDSKLFVGSLSWGTTDQSLHQAFGAFGNVVEARVREQCSARVEAVLRLRDAALRASGRLRVCGDLRARVAWRLGAGCAARAAAAGRPGSRLRAAAPRPRRTSSHLPAARPRFALARGRCIGAHAARALTRGMYRTIVG